MNVLALDTSTTHMTVAWIEDGQLLAGIATAAERNHSIRLVPQIEQFSQQLGRKTATIDGIVCGVGPGSFTGTRIAVSVAKTMAWALNIELVAISSMEALAWSGYQKWCANQMEQQSNQVAQQSNQAEGSTIWIIPLMDARRGQAFTGLYQVDADGKGCTSLQADRIARATDWFQAVREFAQENHQTPLILAVGEIEIFAELTTDDFWTGNIQASALEPESFAEVAWKHWNNSARTNVHELVPNYTQAVEIKSKWVQNA